MSGHSKPRPPMIYRCWTEHSWHYNEENKAYEWVAEGSPDRCRVLRQISNCARLYAAGSVRGVMTTSTCGDEWEAGFEANECATLRQTCSQTGYTCRLVTCTRIVLTGLLFKKWQVHQPRGGERFTYQSVRKSQSVKEKHLLWYLFLVFLMCVCVKIF